MLRLLRTWAILGQNLGKIWDLGPKWPFLVLKLFFLNGYNAITVGFILQYVPQKRVYCQPKKRQVPDGRYGNILSVFDKKQTFRVKVPCP